MVWYAAIAAVEQLKTTVMITNKHITFRSRIKSILFAIAGIKEMIRSEPNARLHLIATVAVIIAGTVKHLTTTQWIALVFAIGFVWITETINTCVEKLCDFGCENQYHPLIKKIKDLSAGAVLIAALTSLVIGIIIFIF